MNTIDTLPTNTPPTIPSAPITQTPVPSQPTLSAPNGLRGWLSFLGLCHLSTGIFSCITLIGILPGIPLIIAGMALLRARTSIEDPVEPEEFMKEIRTAVMGVGWLYLASSILFLIGLIIMIPLIGIAIAHGSDLFSQFSL